MTAQWFGDYEVVNRLRVGGMATLYLARRHGAAGFSRLVTLKMIHPHLVAQPSFIEMFVDEARICSLISHPNVVHVEEFGVLDGVHYLVMEYLDGCSASELLQVLRRERRMLDPELAARVIMQIAGGLHAAHRTCGPDGQTLDLIHRDISPSNLLISVDGNAKLIDFGIAKARNRVSETQAGITLKGKYGYVAPEQASHAVVDRRCDIFSLGIVFWELLVGQQLFPEDSHVGLLNRLYKTEVPAPSTANAAVPEVFDSIVLAMLQHDPADRPQTAAEVQRRIASAIPGAANREPSELGALAIEVRDKCAERRARRPSTESSGSDSNRTFSPTPRSRAASEYRIEVEATHGSGVQGASPPIPSPWWRRRSVQIGAGLIGVGVIVGVLVGRQGNGADANASPAPIPEHARELVVPRDPVTRAEPPSPPLPTVASPPTVPPPPALPLPPTVPPPSSVELPTTAPVTPPYEPRLVAAPTPPVRGAAASAPARGPRRETARVTLKSKPPRQIAGEPDGAEAAPAPRASEVFGAKTPFTAEQFDEPANSASAPTAPAASAAVKGKNVPIVPEFDN
jgi:serine/threonine-protein kinase